MPIRRLLLVLSACLAPMLASAQTPLNLDFERRGDDPASPAGWFIGGQGYEVALDGRDVRSGKLALRMTRQAGAGPGGFGVATASVPAKAARGKVARLAGAIKTEGVEGGYAGLWLRVDGPDGAMLGFDNMTVRVAKGESIPDDRGVRGTTGWKRYTIEVEVDPAATQIVFGGIYSGAGTARFDALTLDIGGVPYEDLIQESLARTPEEIAWLAANSLPFATDRPGTGLDDLRPLRDKIGDARIVSLGEATHGTAEFFRMKHRLLEFLATEMGFTVFAIEASMPEAFRVNDFVLNGQGDPKELLRGMYFWTWNTQEVLDMILWMREFNASGRGRVEFLGFDMQEPKVAAENVRAFVARADPDYAGPLGAAYAGLKDYDQLRQGNDDKTKAELGKIAARAGEVLKHLEDARDRLVEAAGGDKEGVDWAIQNARIVVQAVRVAAEPGDYRDRCMAENVDWILAHRPAGTKAVLWAHNGHVARRPGAMGGFLARRHPDDMVVAGFAFHEGQYTAVSRTAGLKSNDAGPSAAGSVEAALHQAGRPRAILDLRKIDKTSAGSGWLAEPVAHRNIGALAMDTAFFPCDLPGNYDLLIYFDQTTASALLPPHRKD